MRILVGVLGSCAVLLAGCAGAGPSAGYGTAWDARQWEAREMSELKLNWTREQVMVALGKPAVAVGPIHLSDIDRLETWTYYLPVAGTSRGTSAYQMELDRTCGIYLVMLNDRVLRRIAFGDWGDLANRAVLADWQPGETESLDRLQEEWLESVQRDRALQERLDFVKKKLFQPGEEKLPGVVPSHQAPPARGHAGSYVGVGK